MAETEIQKTFSTAKWIWAEGETKRNDLCIFRKVFTLENKLKRPILRIAAETHYFLNINNNFVVWQGGINHAANSDASGYYDEIDVNKYLKKGENAIVIVCHYYGNSGGEVVDKGKAGLIAELVSEGNTVLVTDKDFSVYRNESFKDSDEESSVKFAGFSCHYDATIERPLTGIYLPSYNSNIFSVAKELSDYGEAPFGDLAKRTISQNAFNHKVKFGKKIKSEKDNLTDIYKMNLPSAMHVFPVLIANAQGMEKIKIYTDRTFTEGGFGDKTKYKAPIIEYVCKSAKQVFESFAGFYGQTLYFEVPKTVKQSKLGYRFCGYDSDAIASVDCSEPTINRLAEKCINTLKACITDTVTNNVERDRATTLDSANIAVRALLKSFDSNIHSLIKKTVVAFLDNIKDGIIYSNILSLEPKEISFDGLLAISEMGMFAAYCDYFSDLDQRIFSATIDYLGKWNMSEGIVEPRGGHTDNLYNIDSEVLESCLYYSALNFAKMLAAKIGSYEHDGFINSRLEGYKEAFDTKYFNGLGYSSQSNYCDDRANAFAVLAGLCSEEKYEILSDLLVSVQNASPKFEGFVLEALCKMGKSSYAQRRMSSRYAGLVENQSATLCEDFYLGGAATSSCSVMPLTVMLECFGGVAVANAGTEITISPDLGDLNFFTFACLTPNGLIKGGYKKTIGNSYEYTIHNDCKQEVTVNLKSIGDKPSRTCKITKGKYKYTLE